MDSKQKERYTAIIVDIKRVFSEVSRLPKVATPENKQIMIEKSEELLLLYKEKWVYKRKRYDERLFVKTLQTIIKHKDNPEFIHNLQKAYSRGK